MIKKELLDIFKRLEAHYHDMCDTEFTIEQGKLWMLQTRVGKRTGAAALQDGRRHDQGHRDRRGDGGRSASEEALMRLAGDQLDQVLHPMFANKGKAMTKGLAASPGAAVGKVYFTADDAVTAFEQRGEAVILVRSETSPEDVHGMMVAKGILTARGGLVSHAAVVARGWGTPAVVGAEAVKIEGKQFTVGDTVVNEGDMLSIDGTTGEIILGALELKAAEPPAEFKTILAWADQIRKGHLAVRANADTGEDAANARSHRCRGHRPVPDRAHVPRPRPPAGRSPDDPGQDAGRRGCRARGTAVGAEGRLHRDPRGDGRAAGHRAPARPAAPRVLAVGRGAPREGGEVGSRPPKTPPCSRPPRAGPSTTR